MRLSMLRTTSALASTSFAALLIAAPAIAQVTSTSPEAQSQTTTDQTTGDQTLQNEASAVSGETPVLPATPQADASDSSKDILITGSRIRRSNYNSASPVAIIDPADQEKRGVVDTAELLQSSPIASGSAQVTSAISSNFVTDGGPGASTISLRGLGANRTLVLLNGRRAGPAGTRGAVSSFDLNVLPQSIIQQVQIEKDGASSIYGSDAVAGVVNLITKTRTKGLELSIFGSAPQDQGGDVYRVGGAYGFDWGGNKGGHLLLAADYYHQEELAQGDRKYLSCPEDYVFDRSGKRTDLIDPRTGKERCSQLSWGQVYLYDYSQGGLRTGRGGYSYGNENLGGYLPNLGPRLATGDLGVPSNFYQLGYDPISGALDHLQHPFYGQNSVNPQLKRLTFYGDASQHIGDHVEAYAEGLWNRRNSYTNSSRQFWNYEYTQDLGGPANGFTGTGFISPTPITDHFDSKQEVEYWRVVGGLRGDFGSFLSGWNWDGFVQYSKSVGRYTQDQIYADAVNGSSFRTDGGCQPGEVTSVRGVPCLDVRWTNPEFLAGNPNAAERAYLFGSDTGRTEYKQTNAEFSLSGPVFRLPAGDVQVAAGVTWRRDEILDHPGDIVCGPVANDPYGCVNNAWGVTSSGVTAGRTITEEAFGEVDVPVIHDTPFIQAFNLSGSGRYTQFTSKRTQDGVEASDKGNWTYKIGANWQVNDFLRFRGSIGTSYRAPALFEQFLANQTGFANRRSVDPCINLAGQPNPNPLLVQNCAAAGISPTFTGGSASSVEVLSGGGLGVVRAETSTSKNASVILTPKFGFLPNTRLSIAVDYFDIKVSGEISQLGAGNLVARCYTSQFYPTDPLCGQFDRDPATLAITQVRDSYININSQRNQGIDVTANASQDLGRLGKLSLTAEMTWQMKDYVALFSTTRQSVNGRAGDPIWTGNFNVNYELGTFSIYYGLNVIGGTSDTRQFIRDNGDTCLTSVIYPNGYCERLRAEPTFYHSLSMTKQLPGVQVTLGVTNLFNTHPPRVSVYGNNEISTLGWGPFLSQYDVLGRRGFLSIKTNF